MSLAAKLDVLEDRGAYQRQGVVTKRWGQLLREMPSQSSLLRKLQEAEILVPLHSLGRIHSGVVTRANAFFLVRELPFEQVPKRFGLTRRDLGKLAVIMDGLETPHKVERRFLRNVVKGPEALISPTEFEQSELRLFDVDVDRVQLRDMHAAGALAYLKRGETVAYNVSDDTLKGGIPARRSQIKNRRPHWYNLNVPKDAGPRIVLPEHFDKRYISTLIDASDKSVVIDTLYVFSPQNPLDAEFLLASLNSLLTWYQLELRGRTQHGQGVLKVEIPDYGGILVLNPTRVPAQRRSELATAFRALSSLPLTNTFVASSDPVRVRFDEMYLRCCGWSDAEGGRLRLERVLRAAVGERHERKESVAEAKLDRRRGTDITASIDAYASRLAASIEPYPDPSRLSNREAEYVTVPIMAPVEGSITVGTELFNQGDVFSGSMCVARGGNILSGQYVRGVLLHDPTLTSVRVPAEPELSRVMAAWSEAAKEWEARFDRTFTVLANAITDPRVQQAIRQRALSLLHGE